MSLFSMRPSPFSIIHSPLSILHYPLYIILLLGCTAPRPSAGLQRSPNVVVIFMDDMGYADMGCFGAPENQTPNMDRMAKEGARLTDFYSAQPVCSASRAALLTGCYSNRVSIHQALMPNARIGLNPAETTMADMLKARGYHTAIFGKWHIGDAPQFMPNQQGFDEYFGIPYSGDMWPKNIRRGIGHFKPLYLYENERVVDTLNDQSLLTRQITEHSVRFIEKHRKEPFFLYVPHPQPHVPLHASGDFRGKSGNGMYSDVMAELDWSVGEILNALKTNGVDDNTLVVLTSDNGPWLAYGHQGGSARPLRNGKGTVWEGGVREPCIVRFPGKIPAGSVIATPLMTIDLLPTIAALTGAQLPALPIDGKNALPILTGESVAPLHEALFFYYNVNELQAARFGDWKLYFPHRYLRVDEPGHDGEPGTISMIKMETPELYHLRRDPSETTNVAADNPEIVAQIQALADTMRDRLGDALVKKTGKENREPGRIK